ncbi:hypothetical protein AMTR_s00009p00254200 [Amborella trichopoda]|uniref:Uncharacterized protein n=1 Tax=Amborella trichopoda TaxID=13333 RepID=W1NHX9_AMBTC|nr:hypothetical protein AMTR_s00009p00254200 [Amborella trichopoda]
MQTTITISTSQFHGLLSPALANSNVGSSTDTTGLNFQLTWSFCPKKLVNVYLQQALLALVSIGRLEPRPGRRGPCPDWTEAGLTHSKRRVFGGPNPKIAVGPLAHGNGVQSQHLRVRRERGRRLGPNFRHPQSFQKVA